MNVSKETRQVERVVTEMVDEDVITIELNREETAALIAILGKIGGFTYEKPNLRTVLSDGLWHELQDISGISWKDEVSFKYYNTITQSMMIG